MMNVCKWKCGIVGWICTPTYMNSPLWDPVGWTIIIIIISPLIHSLLFSLRSMIHEGCINGKLRYEDIGKCERRRYLHLLSSVKDGQFDLENAEGDDTEYNSRNQNLTWSS
jgi:hypothetical protein